MRRSILAATWLTIGVVLFSGAPAAADWATGFGCFVCRDYGGQLGASQKCYQVGDKQYGDGTECSNPHSIGGYVCLIGGFTCYNIEVSTPGGGGGSAGGDGGGGCVVAAGAACPAYCSSCSHEAYPRPAI